MDKQTMDGAKMDGGGNKISQRLWGIESLI